MFKYGELSDLIDGSLVIPLYKTEDGQVRVRVPDSITEYCVDFDDFDFDKTPEERIAPNNPNPEPEPNEPINDPNPEPNEPINEPIKEKDDSEYDGTDEPAEEPIVDPSTGEVKERSGFLSAEESKELVELFDIPIDKRRKVKIWKDVI